MVATETRGELARNAIGLREVLFQSITHMAPGAAVAFSIIVGANFAAGALPLSILFALVGCLFVAISIGQLAKHLPSAAGFATYASRGLHPSVGFLVAWGYALAEALVAPLLYLIFANVVAGTLNAEYGWSYDTWWPIAAVVAAVLVLLFGWFGIRLSAGAGTLLGLFEIVVFAALAVSREAQTRTGASISKIVKTLRPLRTATITLAGQQIQVPPRVPDDAQHLLDDLRGGH